MRTLVEGPIDAGTSPLNGLFTSAIEATEEAVYNALVAAETTAGINGHVLQAIPHDRLRTILQHLRTGTKHKASQHLLACFVFCSCFPNFSHFS